MEPSSNFAEALKENDLAKRNFDALTDDTKLAVIQWANGLQSDTEIQQLVHNIAGGSSHINESG